MSENIDLNNNIEEVKQEQKVISQRVQSLVQKIDDKMSNSEVIDAYLAAGEDNRFPWEDVELPSLGLYYGWSSGYIKVRPWGAKVDKIMATQRLSETGQSLDYMFNVCCQFPDGFDATDLLVGDQIFLLYYLRGITHGNIYEFAATAPSGKTCVNRIDLNTLASSITRANPALGIEPFRVDLPYLSKQLGRACHVGVRFLRVKDSQLIQRRKKTIQTATGQNSGVARVRERKKTTWEPGMPANYGTAQQPASREKIPIDDDLTANISKLVVNIMGEVTDRYKIEKFVDSLHSSDLAYLREWLADNTPGIETQVILTDPENGEEFRVMLPITESFFRSQETGGVRT